MLYGVWHGTRLEALTIDEVVVSGGETISHSQIVEGVSEILEGEYLRFIPRRFVWLYPKNDVLEYVAAVERVKNPKVKRDGTTLVVTIAEYEPIALWCDDGAQSACVFLDDTGYGFARTPALTGGAFTRFVRIGESAAVNEYLTSNDDYLLLRELESLLEAFGWSVTVIEFDQARDVFINLAQGGELKVSLRISPTQTMDNLQTVLVTDEYAELTPGAFEYIDLRFGNKVFVNEFGVPEVEVEAESATTTQNAASDDAAD